MPSKHLLTQRLSRGFRAQSKNKHRCSVERKNCSLWRASAASVYRRLLVLPLSPASPHRTIFPQPSHPCLKALPAAKITQATPVNLIRRITPRLANSQKQSPQIPISIKYSREAIWSKLLRSNSARAEVRHSNKIVTQAAVSRVRSPPSRNRSAKTAVDPQTSPKSVSCPSSPSCVISAHTAV